MNYPSVNFAQISNPVSLPIDVIKAVKTIASILASRNEMLSSDFVFHFGSLPITDPDLVVRDIYVVSTSVERVLDPEEELICGALQEIIRIEKTRDRITNAIAHVVEYYHVIKKKHKYGKAVSHRVNLFIGGRKVTHLGREEIDIGIDRLAGDWALEMCECTTRAGTFWESKSDQVDFYAEAFRQIRSILDSQVTLTMEFVAGHTTRKGFKPFSLPIEFANSNIRVIGISLSTGQKYVLN